MAAVPFSPEFLCMLDFEATCERDRLLRDQEIIQFPSVLLKVQSRDPAHNTAASTVESEFQRFMKPTANPLLSSFCTELTGIRQEQVDEGVGILEALDSHCRWLADETSVAMTSRPLEAIELDIFTRVLVITCGDWDLKQMLPKQAKREGFAVPLYLQRWCNIKRIFSLAYGSRATGMAGMLAALSLPLQGRHHNGLDDCRNIAIIVGHMLQDGHSEKIVANGWLLQEPSAG